MDDFIAQMAVDNRLRQGHLCLYVAVAYMGRDHSPGDWFRVTRRKLMKYAGIRSFPTYHKYLGELVSYGYLDYRPSYDYYQGSRMRLVVRETMQEKGI